MSKHTPGPWTFREYAMTDQMLAEAKTLGIKPIRFINNDGSVPVSSAETKICNVDCQASFKRGSGHQAECEERDANARLIAAAPELLEALKQIAAIGPASDAFANLELAREKARAAIAKAEGRT